MNLTEAFRHQAISCAALGSPFMAQLLSVLADNWPASSALDLKFATFKGDIGPAGHSLPLRTAAGLHALVLTGQDDSLAQVYPPNSATDAALCDAVLAALDTHAAFLSDWTNSPPQTNEVRRSAAFIAGARVAAAHFDLPIHLSELGASGGLNLMWDHYGLEVNGTYLGPDDPVLLLKPDWEGPLPPAVTPVIATRAGVDLNPMNPKHAKHLLRLTAYLWPDQPERLTLTRAAASVTNTPVQQGDAIEWLADRLDTAPQGQLHLIQHSVAWQYFPTASQARGIGLIQAAGALATPERPLAWLSMESDGDTKGSKGAAIILRLWPGDIQISLGRADFHGRWIDWHYDPT